MSDLTTEERLSKIRAAVRQLDRAKDTDWTKTGLPDGDRVKDLTGFRSVTDSSGRCPCSCWVSRPRFWARASGSRRSVRHGSGSRPLPV